MRAFLRRRPVLIGLAVVALLAAGAGVAAWLLVLKEPGDVSNPDVAFEAPPPPPASPDEEADEPERRKPKAPPRVDWPRYGYTPQRTRRFRPAKPIRGPFRVVWRRPTGALAEFPPSIYDGTLYHLIDDGMLYALDARTGKARWKRKLGTLSASAPAVDERRVYVTLLVSDQGGPGRVVALHRRSGKIAWSKALPSRTESSPLLHRGRLYLGSEDGTFYALDADTGRTVWTYRAAGAIKGAPALSDGVLFFGSYGGDVQAVRAANGRLVWKASPARRAIGGGNFYASPAVAFGRVYIGATDGRAYSLSTRNGALAWARQTGAYIYGSAAVDNVPGLGPTVFFGSYDRNLHAFDARTGQTRWTARAPGRVSGGVTVVGGTVYFADLDAQVTTGVSTRTGRQVFRRSAGKYDPIVSDGRWLYLTGAYSLQALKPVGGRRR